MARSATNRQRVIDYGEVFTPYWLVKDIIELISDDCNQINSRFLEPSCGDGNFLCEVLRRKLMVSDRHDQSKWQVDAVLAVCSLYGIDLLLDNVTTCRYRLLEIVENSCIEYFDTPPPACVLSAISHIVSKNVLQGDTLSMRTSSSDLIILSEWSLVGDSEICRRDFTYEDLVNYTSLPDSLLPIKEYQPCHYLKVADLEKGHGNEI